MLDRLFKWLARLRNWLLVRLGLWRGQWRRGQVAVPSARLFSGPLANDSWSYGLYCPRALRDDEPAPLVVLLHGCKQRALGFAQASGFTRAADAQRFRLLCPEQRRRANLWRCWNWFTPAAQRGQGELGVVRAMLDDVVRQVAIAPGSVAVVGLSAGGGLGALLAFHAADRIDAVAVVAAPPLLGSINLQDPRDVMKRGLLVAPTLVLGRSNEIAPLMVVQGLADPVVNPRCAEQLVEQALRVNQRSGPTLQASETLPAPGIEQTDHRAGDALRLRALHIDSLGHAWSGAPGGHPFVEAAGAALTDLTLRFLRDAGPLAQRR
jgi:poly(hydroxyalkanoate) depolymerase family esterase